MNCLALYCILAVFSKYKLFCSGIVFVVTGLNNAPWPQATVKNRLTYNA